MKSPSDPISMEEFETLQARVAMLERLLRVNTLPVSFQNATVLVRELVAREFDVPEALLMRRGNAPKWTTPKYLAWTLLYGCVDLSLRNIAADWGVDQQAVRYGLAEWAKRRKARPELAAMEARLTEQFEAGLKLLHSGEVPGAKEAAWRTLRSALDFERRNAA